MVVHKPKLTGHQKYIAALSGANIGLLEELTRKEASRQVGEMLRWKKYHEDVDPLGVSFGYEMELYPLIEKAVRYRHRIYNWNKRHAEVEFEFTKAVLNEDWEAKGERQAELADIEDARIALCWRVRKIYMYVSHKALLDVTEDDDIEGFFKEYEY